MDTACLDIGGRLIKINNERITYISDKMKVFLKKKNIHLSEGDRVSPSDGENIRKLIDITECMTDILEQSVGLVKKTDDLEFMKTNKLIEYDGIPDIITFSGGVADCIYKEYDDEFKFHDIGILFGKSIAESTGFKDYLIGNASETMRATVVGAGNYSMDVSGSTIEYQNCRFPIKNIPVVYVDIAENDIDSLAERIKKNAEAVKDGEKHKQIALASKGVLFLDELPLFSKSSIEALRQPLEEKKVVINRLNGSFLYPADCMLVAAMNPCPCGYYPDRNKCHCTESQIRHYQRGISKPILERIDLCVEASPVSFEEATSSKASVSSAELRKQVQKARAIQKIRFENCSHLHVNADMGAKDIEKFCPLNQESKSFIGKIFELKSLSMRTYHKVLKVARTIADLEGAEDISISHLSEAVSYRGLEDHLYGTLERCSL